MKSNRDTFIDKQREMLRRKMATSDLMRKKLLEAGLITSSTKSNIKSNISDLLGDSSTPNESKIGLSSATNSQVTNEELELELKSMLYQILDSAEAITDLVENQLSQDEIVEFITNFDFYKAKIRQLKLKGTINYSRFVLSLKNILAEKVNMKYNNQPVRTPPVQNPPIRQTFPISYGSTFAPITSTPTRITTPNGTFGLNSLFGNSTGNNTPITSTPTRITTPNGTFGLNSLFGNSTGNNTPIPSPQVTGNNTPIPTPPTTRTPTPITTPVALDPISSTTASNPSTTISQPVYISDLPGKLLIKDYQANSNPIDPNDANVLLKNMFAGGVASLGALIEVDKTEFVKEQIHDIMGTSKFGQKYIDIMLKPGKEEAVNKLFAYYQDNSVDKRGNLLKSILRYYASNPLDSWTDTNTMYKDVFNIPSLATSEQTRPIANRLSGMTNGALFNLLDEVMTIDQKAYAEAVNRQAPIVAGTGIGGSSLIRSKRGSIMVVGSGSANRKYYVPANPHILVSGNKYYIDKNLLDNQNIIEIRYTKNRHLTNVKPHRISNKMKDLVYKLVNNTLEDSDINGLKTAEKALLKVLAKMFNINMNVMIGQDEMDEDFNIMIGEIEAGNDSELLKRKLKSYIYTFIQHGRISRSAGMNLINQYGL